MSTEKETDNQQTKTDVPENTVVEQSPHFKGMVANKNDKIDRLRRENEALQVQLAQALGTRSTSLDEKRDDDFDMDDDDLLTVAQFKKLQTANEKKRQEQQERERQAQIDAKYQQAEAKAKRELTIEKCGDGLDYVTVLEEGKSFLTKGDLLNIQNADDPAREAYDACLRRNATLYDRAEAQRNQTLVSKLNDDVNGPRRKTGSRKPGADELDDDQQILTADEFTALADLPDSELEKMIMERGTV